MLLALSNVTYVLIGWFNFLLLKFLYEYGPCSAYRFVFVGAGLLLVHYLWSGAVPLEHEEFPRYVQQQAFRLPWSLGRFQLGGYWGWNKNDVKLCLDWFNCLSQLMHCSAKFQAPPNAVDFLWSCEGVFFLCFLGQNVTWQYIPNLLD